MNAAGKDGRTVVLGVSAGIAAYKAVEVCRRLVDSGCHVVVVMTPDATRFVGTMTFSALASEPVVDTMWDPADPLAHTRLAARASLVVVAPATADLLARYANGMANDVLSATLLATKAPVLVCPAMHEEMWEHPATQDNIALLKARGVAFVEPGVGRLAGGDVGKGRLADPEVIVGEALRVLSGGGVSHAGLDLAGMRVLVTAGGTREPIDPVRYIGNRSSGKQGHAIALEAAERGADVVLVSASEAGIGSSGQEGLSIRRVDVETAEEMAEAVLREAERADAVVMAAAVADFRPERALSSKHRKTDGAPEIRLVPTRDILSELASRRRPGQVLVGFAAETGDAADKARAKLEAKGLDLIVANDVAAPEVGFGHDTNAVTMIGADGTVTEVPLAPKTKVAAAVIDRVVEILASKRGAAAEKKERKE
jgi:phosphopantothenoylcysteine decarboxylase/phosphopantothenate--cysteine ligase